MEKAPKSLRLHIGLFGRTNTGKSSYLNMITGQSVSITSPFCGTTTDVVEKTMELLPLGPVVFLDTAGMDDTSPLGITRVEKTKKALASSDIALLILENGIWSEYEQTLLDACTLQKTPVILIVNKIDQAPPDGKWLERLQSFSVPVLVASCCDGNRERYIMDLKKAVIELCPEDYLSSDSILCDLLPPTKDNLPLVILIVPVDMQAPKGRLILPQVQSIRDCLDHNAAVSVVTTEDYPRFLTMLNTLPDLVVCDSQVVDQMVKDTPPSVACTTFSILFSRFKGNIEVLAEGSGRLSNLREGDAVLIAEACSHHPMQDDIGRVKIPRWIEENCGPGILIDSCAGKDYPTDLEKYSLIIHCGGCTLTRREMLWRIEQARAKHIPITNYGIAISVLRGVVERTLSPFPDALLAYKKTLIAVDSKDLG